MSFLSFFARRVGQPVTYYIAADNETQHVLDNFALLQKTAQNAKEQWSVEQYDTTKRGIIALWFVISYILLVFTVIFGVPLYNWLAIGKPQSLDVTQVLTEVGTLLGSPLGFVLGYYFKGGEKDKS
jgi:hypothetical protein